jgi:lysophospholipase L1-like esterase
MPRLGALAALAALAAITSLQVAAAGCARSAATAQRAPAAATTAAVAPAPFEDEIQRFERADRERPVAPGGVLFVGSSSLRMWSTLAEDFPGVPVTNRGFGGSQLEDVLRYLDRVVTPYAPRLVLVYGGDNDLNAGKTPERVLADYQTVVRRIHEKLPRTRVAFISIKPSPSRWHLAPQVRAANDLVRSYAAGDPRLLYIDVYSPMLGPDGAPRRELFLDDMLHMKPEGYAIWRSAIAPYLR